MIYETRGKTSVILWESVAEPEATLKGAWEWKHQGNRSRCDKYTEDGRGKQDWLGAPTQGELRKRLTAGWPAGVKKLEELAVEDAVDPQSVRRRRVRGDQGDEIDMQAVWRGDISRAWTRTRRTARSSARSVSIVVDLGASCAVGADALFWRGASALKLTEKLTEAGYNVALYGAGHANGIDQGGSRNCIQYVEIKGEDSPLDMDKLAALTAMPGFFRTSLFVGFTYCCDREDVQVDSGLGVPAPDLIAKHIEGLPIPQDAIVQPSDVLNKAAAERWVKTVLDGLATPV